MHRIRKIRLATTDTFVCEVKATDRVDERHARTLRLFGTDFGKARFRLISRDPKEKDLGGVIALPWEKAVEEMVA